MRVLFLATIVHLQYLMSVYTDEYDPSISDSSQISAGCKSGLNSANWQKARSAFWKFRSAHFHGNTTEWKGSEDIRSHMQEIFSFTLFFCPRSIVELGVREGWSTRAFAAAADIIGARMVGVDHSPYCDDTYAAVRLPTINLQLGALPRSRSLGSRCLVPKPVGNQAVHGRVGSMASGPADLAAVPF